jgi:CMP-N-acetylneuraminic acid synthetase
MTPFFWEKCEEGGRPLYNLKNRQMRQDIVDEDFYYHDNGNVYITKVSSFLKSRIRVSGKTFLYETPDFESMQIDTPDDFAIMTKMYEHYGSFL